MAQSLLNRVASGDMAAMKECMDEYGGLVWSLARRLSDSPADAEDAVQETFIAIWENAGRYDESLGTEVTFVATIARRRLIDRRRKTQRQKRLLSEVQSEAQSKPVGATSEDRPAVRDEVDRVRKAMERLGEDQQRVLGLAIHRGLTHEQIAHQTGLPLGTVKTHARRGLQRIRALLQESSSSLGAAT